jgi:gliding motility-associated-like protein/uncharacterized repeat protein (TIGR01451 family)
VRRPTLTLLFTAFIALASYAQNFEPFTPRFNQDVKGDIMLIGNNILGPGNSAFNDNTVFNHNVDMRYIDIDSDPSTFSSSSADLTLPNPNCYRIIHAGLYWGAVNPGAEPIRQVKFKGPVGDYIDLEGTVIYDAGSLTTDGGNSFSYACFADVTDIVNGFSSNLGTYTVANVSSAEGETGALTPFNGTGHSAGWSLFIVYEDPTLPGKSITSFDGFSAISVSGGNPTLDIPVDGFRTVPAPAPVRANFAFATLEGDSPILGDRLILNGVTLSTPDRPVDNFFNSSVTQLDALPVNNRVPNSTNTLGFDTGVLPIPNPGNSVIANDATSATITLETSGDTYFPYFFAFAVDIIEPDIVLTKLVEDDLGNDIGGQTVGLNEPLNYVIGFQNTGNDDATNFQIRDVLPINIIYNHPTDLVLPPGVTVSSYDPVTRELIFDIDNSLVEVNDPQYFIRLEVQTVETCQQLADACSNIINNQAFATYNGFFNPNFQISDDPSINSNTGCLLAPQATNFLADLDDCVFSEEYILCGPSIELTAANGYDTYTWSNDASGSPVLGTGQTFTATQPGTYYSFNNAIAPCQSIVQEYEVITFGAGVTNPLIPFADEVVICPNDGKQLPNFYLCGANDFRSIVTGITDTTSMIWEQLDESSCPAVANSDCANENSACSWNEVGTGPDFTINTSGEFRLTLNYDGGCFNQFYFNVYQNLLDPNVTTRDIYCDTLGEIAVGGVPSGYEYSLDGVSYQASPIFSIATPGQYTVYVRQIGVTSNPCVFTVPDILIRDRDFTVSTIVEQPLCYDDFGSIYIAANDVRPQYFFEISQGATLVNSVGPITENNFTFQNLSPGIYTVTVTTEDGCTHTEDIEIIQPPTLEVTAAITEPLNCTDGEITIYANGGTAPYFYFVNSSVDFQTVPTFTVTSSGTYDITVVDANNCSASTSIVVDAVLAPEYNVLYTDEDCVGGNGTITVDVTNANGNTLEFSIDGGLTFSNSPVFTGLDAGDYQVLVQYSIAGDICATDVADVTIAPAVTITADVAISTEYSCTTPGTITVGNVLGGTAPYSYSIDGVNFQSAPSFTNLGPGVYSIWVEDASGCAQGVGSVTIDPLDPPTDMELSNTAILCPSNTITLTVDSTTGGVAPLEYQIISPSTSATPYQSSNEFTGLQAGTYTIQVRDANDCTYSETYTIAPIAELSVSAQVDKLLDCSISPDAEISGVITSGVGPYTYAVSVNGGAYTDLGSTGVNFNYQTSIDGTYQFEVTDSNGCTATTEVLTISPLIPVTLSLDLSDPNCTADSNGVIKIGALTGEAPFEFSIDGGATFVSTNVFGGLSAGTYNYVVRDANECEASGSVTLNDPLPIAVDIVSNPIQCNSNVPGSIDVTITSGGVAPFNYTIYDPGFTQLDSSVSNSNTVHSFTGLGYGDYYIGIVDANGCEFLSDLVRIETPPNISLIGNTTTGTCVTGATVEIEVVSGVAPFTYSIFGQPATAVGPTASTTHVFTGLDHGVTYQFQVIDAGGCFSIIEVTTPVLSAIDVVGSASSNVSCFGGSDGSLDFTVSNYDASVSSLTYEVLDALTNNPIIPTVNGNITGLTGSPVSGTVSGLPAGSYTLMVREADGTVCNASLSFVITQPSQDLLAAVGSVENATCNRDAQVIIDATGGTAPYSYASGAVGFTPAAGDFATNNVLNLDPSVATDWDVVVRDANGCEVRLTQSISTDPSPEIALSTVDNCLLSEGDFEVEVSLVTAGVGPYALSVNGSAFESQSFPYVISGLNSGTHTVEVRDFNGCTNVQTITIEAPLSIVPEITTRTSCNNDDGVIAVNTAGGSGNFAYSISPLVPSISLAGNSFTGVPSGTYTITVDDLTTGCNTSVEVFMPEAEEPTIFMTPTGVNCFGGNDGGFELLVQGYTGTYTYEVFDQTSTLVMGPVSVSTSVNPQFISGLASGTYEVVINQTQTPFCSASGTVIITSPQQALDLVLQETANVTCDNDSGVIVALASGGTPQYEYELSGPVSVPFSDNGTFEDLVAGTYTVTARDAQGCIASETITLSVPPAINADVAAITNPLLCYGDANASIEITNVTGGQGGNYSYTLNTLQPVVSSSGPQTTPIFTNLSAGTYQVEISDGLNCIFQSVDIVIDQPTELITNLVTNTTQTCLTSASLTLSASGGTGTYTYSTDPDFTTVIGSFTNSVTFDVAPGVYQYYVRDASGCISSVSNEITIDQLPPLELILDTTNSAINCSGDSTGVIAATAQGGLGNYDYALEDENGNVLSIGVETSPGVFTELPAGDYVVTVSSGDCDVTALPVSIEEPDNPLLATASVSNVTCSGSNDGVITIGTTGGTGIIKYAISPQLDQFFDEPVFENLSPGDYQIIVQDELGCFELIDASVTEPEPVILSIVPDSIFPEVCSGDQNGEFSISISGGSLPYSVSLDNPDGPFTTGTATQTDFDFTDLSGGDHIVYISDSAGCTSEWNITFPASVSINPLLEIEYNCDNSNSVGNVVTVSLADASIDPVELDYSLNGGPFQPSPVFNNVAPGRDQYIEVRHTNGCIQSTEMFTIEEVPPIDLVLQEGELNEIIATAAGGSEIYEYFLNGESYGSTNTFIVYESGVYTVSVRDSYGCEVSATITIEYVDVCIPNYFTPNNDGVLDEWGPGCATQYQNLTFDIFDRYGRKVASLRVNEKWDGTYDGRELPTGDYWYVVRLNDANDDRDFVGHFTLYR